MPVPIESVDEDSKKCPICWKPYGEAADPGFDNSEQPVRLKCRHTFGNKCMLATFAVPGTSTITLEPLAFGQGSKGYQLGQRLHSHLRESRALETNGNAVTFTEMLHTRRESLTEIFG
jgi:hypothetical protein